MDSAAWLSCIGPTWFGIDNTDRKLSFHGSMSFFIFMNHDKDAPIIEYNSPGTAGIPGLHLQVHWTDGTALHFNMGLATIQPWFRTGKVRKDGNGVKITSYMERFGGYDLNV